MRLYTKEHLWLDFEDGIVVLGLTSYAISQLGEITFLTFQVGTMEKHWEGILGFWRFGGATNAAMEGFNNKVRTMLRQAYGYRDDEYMILKIYDLPNRKLQVVI